MVVARVVWCALLCALPSVRLGAQNATPNSAQDTTASDVPRVFLDCQADGCDTDFLRTELTWLNFVRDRNVARVHILVTDRNTSSGGSEITATFTRQGTAVAQADTIVQFLPQSATDDESRKVVARILAQGMIRFIAGTPLASRLTVSYRAPTGKPASDTRGARDPWHLWVFRLSNNGFINGDENYKASQVNGNFRASRTTAALKTSWSFGGNYREQKFKVEDGEKAYQTYYQHGWNSDFLFVKSAGEHWSLGTQGNANSSSTANLDLSFRLGPAIEYDLYPYSQSTRRQVVFRYGPGMRVYNYHDTTIFNRVKESHFDHRVFVAAELTQPWGSLAGSSTFNQLLNDLSKTSVDVNAFVSWRIVTGLNLNLGGGYSKIRDQLSLRKDAATEEERLLRLRQLRTGYSFFGNIGLSYTFGSIFQNVVNPRFSQSGGGFFFFN